jgi:hypothetical protein
MRVVQIYTTVCISTSNKDDPVYTLYESKKVTLNGEEKDAIDVKLGDKIQFTHNEVTVSFTIGRIFRTYDPPTPIIRDQPKPFGFYSTKPSPVH